MGNCLHGERAKYFVRD
jgi:hypothetical protein